MDLTVPISFDVATKLRERAASAGKAPEKYAAEVLARELTRPSLDELLLPIRQEVEESGMTEDQLADLLEKAKHEMRLSHSIAR